MAALLVVAMVGTYLKLNGNIDRIDVSKAVGKNRPTPAGNLATGPLNILLIGSDVREGDGNEAERLDLLLAHRQVVEQQLAEVTSHLRAIDHKIGFYEGAVEQAS